MTAFYFLWALISFTHAGTVWPQPQSITRGTSSYSIDPSAFVIQPSPTSVTALLTDAINRYYPLIFPFKSYGRYPEASVAVTVLSVVVTTPENNPPLVLGIDESYSLSITTSGQATLTAPRIWGAIRGLETFSQLVDFDLTSLTYYIANASITIQDYPRYPWRGLLIDTGRHYLSPSTILRTIDALAYNKLNVLHWHVVDAQSFPFQSTSYPLLSGKGAYHPTLAIYNKTTIQNIVQYGYARGVRVVAEFDVPGHAYSWGQGYPTIRAVCPASYSANINNFPLDPSNNFTYQVLDGVISELTSVFTDANLHTGGDEIVYNCWTQDANISAWMKNQGYTTGNQVLQYFEDQLNKILSKYNYQPIVWQEVFSAGVTMPSNTLVEVWKDSATMQSVLSAGYRGILAYGNYLDKQQPIPTSSHYEFEDTWIDFYQNEPLNGITKNANLIVGVEAAMWGEQVDDTCIDERVWPRASAVGERGWSAQTVTNTQDATIRLNSFRCRVARRGINGGPVAPDFCPLTI